MVDHVAPVDGHPALADGSKWSFLKHAPVVLDPRLSADEHQNVPRINVGLTVNHAPMGAMMRHRTRHQLIQRAGEKSLASSIYPLDREDRYTALHTRLEAGSRRSSKGAVGLAPTGAGAELQLPPVAPGKRAARGGWTTTQAQAAAEAKARAAAPLNLFQANPAECFNSFQRLEKQNLEITTVAHEKFIDSLKHKAVDQLQALNALKGGDARIQAQADSGQEHFRYDVFRRQVFEEEYVGISKMVRERLNDPHYYNSRLRGIAESVRENIARREEAKEARRGTFARVGEAGAEEQLDEEGAEFEQDSPGFREKYTNSNLAAGKPPKVPRKQPVYGFQRQYLPIRNRV